MIERVFLGWDGPFLRAAARLLADRKGGAGELRLDGVVVVTPGARAGRRLKELLLEEALERGLRLVPPRIVQSGIVPEMLYEPELPLASPALQRRVWALALQALPPAHRELVFPTPPELEDLRGWSRLGSLVQKLHTEVGGAGYRFADVVERFDDGLLFSDTGRWAALGIAQDEYATLLREFGFADPGLERIAATGGTRARLALELWLVGVSEMPLVTRRLIESGARSGPSVVSLVQAPPAEANGFDETGCVLPSSWMRRPVPIGDDAIAVRGSPADQAEEVVRVIAGLDGRFAPDEILIALPDSELLPFVAQRLDSADLPIHAAQGPEVVRSPPIRLLAAFADFAESRRFAACAELVRHPDLWAWLDRNARAAPEGARTGDWVAALDRFHAERLPATLRRLTGSSRSHAGEVVSRVCAALDGVTLLGRKNEKRALSAWMPDVLRLVAEIYGTVDVDTPRGRKLVEVGERLKRAAASLFALPRGASPACTASEAIRLLIDELEADRIAPEAEQPAVELVGWLELHLDDAPVAVVCGFNDPFLPESKGADPFLPNALRSSLGLVDNDRRYARDAYHLTALLHSTEVVRVIAGRRSAAGDPLRPSRLLFAVEGPALARRVERFYGEGGDGDGPPAARHDPSTSRFRLPPEPEISAPEPPTRLSVSRFRSLLADPYLYALESILRLETVDDSAAELDGMAFGNLTHDVLEAFGRTDAAASSDDGVIRRTLNELLDRFFVQRYGNETLPAVRLQAEQLRLRLNAFAAWQANWVAEGWRTVGVESTAPEGGVHFPVDGKDFYLTGRIDRIDHHPEHGWALLDYKTADRGETPEKTHRKGRAGSKEWIDLQLPLYRHLLPDVLDPATKAPARGEQVGLGYIRLSREPADTGVCWAEWSEDELAGADERARDVVRQLRENRFVFDRSAATRYRGSLGALVGVGNLEAGDEVEVVE